MAALNGLGALLVFWLETSAAADSSFNVTADDTAHYSAIDRLIKNAWKIDGPALRQRFGGNFRLPATVKFWSQQSAFHVVVIVRKGPEIRGPGNCELRT